MHQFSQAWEAARAALNSGDLHDDLKSLKWGLKAFLGGGEPPKDGKLPDKLREIVDRKAAQIVTSAGVPLHEAKGRAIVGFAGGAGSKAERAAMLKMIYHLYMIGTAGSQVFWVYAPPTCYSKWIFSEVKNINTDPGLIAVLGKAGPEVYNQTQRADLLDAVLTAKSLCLGASALSSRRSASTLALIRNYFSTSAAPAAQIDTIANRLARGFQSMAGVLNRGTVVISDEPKDRSDGGWQDFAMAYIGEAMCVIYVQGGMLSKIDNYGGGDSKSLMRAARTIVHETSHKAVQTDDVIYGSSGGLKPEGSADLTPEYAIWNADSWAYYCVDLNGKLRPGASARARTPAPAIDDVPTTKLLV